MEFDKDLRSIQEVRDLVAKAKAAQEIYAGFSQSKVDAIVKAVAEACAANAQRLAKMAVEETGFGISEYLSMIRLQHAKHLLRSSPDLCVAEIADLCGYNDSNYFSEQFKRNCGVSPRAFRKG